MKTILKARWCNKRVTASIDRFYIQDGFNKTFRMKIKVEETYSLPDHFIKGAVHSANQDIIETFGGLPNYVAKILDDAAIQKQIRRTTPIDEQLTLF